MAKGHKTSGVLVIKMLVESGKTLDEIAKYIGMTKEAVKDIQYGVTLMSKNERQVADKLLAGKRCRVRKQRQPAKKNSEYKSQAELQVAYEKEYDEGFKVFKEAEDLTHEPDGECRRMYDARREENAENIPLNARR